MQAKARDDAMRSSDHGIGMPVRRKEDDRLLRGGGRYTDDFSEPGMLHGLFLRSDVAHGVLGHIDTAAARTAPGVELVLTAKDIDGRGYGDLPCAVALEGADGTAMVVPPHPSLARDRVRYVGQPIALVVARSVAEARDALELIGVEATPLPAVTDLTDATSANAPQLHAEAARNTVVTWESSDREAVNAAFARAAHVTRLRLDINRVMVAPLEPRGAIVAYSNERWTVRTGCQGVFGLRARLADAMGVSPSQMRVLAEDVGGSFGMKSSIFPEHVPLMHAARELGCSIKWINDRRESFLTDYHGRHSLFDAELALDAEGGFLAVRLDGKGSVGAYVAGFGPAVPTMVIWKNLPSLYRTPHCHMRVEVVLTNTTPLTAYRGAGRPEANYIMERLIEKAAHETGRDPLDLRRRNMIAPSEIPFRAASGQTYDSGDFAGVLDRLHAAAGHDDVDRRRKEAAARGRLLGVGIASYLEVTAPPGREMGGIRFDALRQGDDRHRHARLWPGTCFALRSSLA